MTKLIYREVQYFRQSFVPWIALLILLFSLGSFSTGIYQKIYNHEVPLSAEINELIWGSIISLVVLGGLFIVFMYSKLTTEIWTDGIRFKFTPLLRKTRFIPLNHIVSAQVQKYKPIIEFGGWGWRVKFLSRKTAYNIKGNMGLRIIKKDGSQVLFGTQQGDSLSKAIDEMLKKGALKTTQNV